MGSGQSVVEKHENSANVVHLNKEQKACAINFGVAVTKLCFFQTNFGYSKCNFDKAYCSAKSEYNYRQKNVWFSFRIFKRGIDREEIEVSNADQLN